MVPPRKWIRIVVTPSTLPDRLRLVVHPADDYRTLNKANWDERAPAHAASPGYHLDAFREDPAYLSDVVRFDLPLLGDMTRAARRPPPVPHRHRHDLAGPARRRG